MTGDHLHQNQADRLNFSRQHDREWRTETENKVKHEKKDGEWIHDSKIQRGRGDKSKGLDKIASHARDGEKDGSLEAKTRVAKIYQMFRGIHPSG